MNKKFTKQDVKDMRGLIARVTRGEFAPFDEELFYGDSISETARMRELELKGLLNNKILHLAYQRGNKNYAHKQIVRYCSGEHFSKKEFNEMKNLAINTDMVLPREMDEIVAFRASKGFALYDGHDLNRVVSNLTLP